MPAYEIPLTTGPQEFTLPLAGIVYSLRLLWNTVSQSWTLDISDVLGNAVLTGIPLVTGIDLLEQYAYLGLGGKLFVQTDGDVDAVPTFESLGNGGRLFFVTGD